MSFWRLQYAGTVAGFGFDRQVCDILHSNILNSDVFEYECICTPYSAEDDIGGVVVLKFSRNSPMVTTVYMHTTFSTLKDGRKCSINISDTPVMRIGTEACDGTPSTSY